MTGHAAPGRRLASWRGADDLSRIDTCAVDFAADTVSAVGTSRTDEYAATWQLETGPDWVTQALRVQVFGHGWRRSIDLRRAADGRWSAESEHHGDVDMAPPGLADPDSVAEALDCDLGLCPLTNIMPIRRLGLHTADAPPARLVMAWIDMPSLQVVRSEQWYSSSTNSSGMREIHFASDGFEAALSVDDAGIVVDYPGLANRI